ncbi:hypothetical protein H8L32_15180 [Undibacterium sp. CY18W]|uniref:Uncharacterized protein n=1 Tax=Undibacterium hunanense TaxID=2762292 RepID=A0ABR6ZTD7_9BURK|nr:hypothetical protein [Undibacterium hunanense]
MVSKIKATDKQVEIVPMEVSRVSGDASARKVDFILANPNQILMRKQQASKALSNR